MTAKKGRSYRCKHNTEIKKTVFEMMDTETTTSLIIIIIIIIK